MPPDLMERLARLLAEEVGPALHMDGTAIEVLDFDQGVLRLRLHPPIPPFGRGGEGGCACGSCPSSIMTIVMGLEQELRRHVPQIEYLEAVP